LVRWVEAPFTPLPYELTLSGLLAPMRRIDLSQIVPPPQFALGWGLLAFAVPGIVASLLDHKIRHLSVMLLMGTGLILLIGVGIDPTSTWLLGPLSLGFAILGAGALRLKRYVSVGYQRVMLPLFLTLALMLATPVWLAPTWTDSEIDLSRAEQIAYEQRGLGAAVLPPGSAIPGTLLPGVQPNAALIESYSQDSTNALRVNPNDNRLGRRVNLLSGQSHQDRYQVRTDPVVIDIERAYFAGWQARVNGITVPVRADASTGLMQVELPRTTGDVLTVFLGSTAARQGAWLLSWVALMLLIIGAVARLRRQARSYTYVMALLTVQEARLLFIISLGFLAAVLIFARPQSPYTLHVRPGSGVDNAIEVGARTVFGMEVMATQVSDEIVTDQDTLDIMVAWRNVTQRPFSRNYQVSVFLQRPNSDSRWLYVEPVTPGGLPTRRWPVGGYVRTDFSLKIPPSIPVGEYRVGVEVYDCTTRCTLSQRISFTDANGVAVGSTLLLPPVVTIQR